VDRLGFGRRVRLEFWGSLLSSDGDLLVMCGLDVRAILTKTGRPYDKTSLLGLEDRAPDAKTVWLCDG